MSLGVRSYGNSLHMQNIFKAEALPDTIPTLKAFCTKVLEPQFICRDTDCGTTIGRRVPIPEIDTVGLIDLETNQMITEEDVYESLNSGEYFHRVRDTTACLTDGGFCVYCGNGYNARLGIDTGMAKGGTYVLKSSPRAYQNYIASTYSGSLLGFSTLTSDPLSAPSGDWAYITDHSEMNRMCDLLKSLKVNRDEMEYLYTIEDILERALAIIGVYGVYGYA